MAPPGTRFVAHEKKYQQASWDPHGDDGYYLGPELDHYRCYQVHITKTKGIWIVDTVEFFSSKTAMPQTSSKYITSIAAVELSNALQNPAPVAPFSHIGTPNSSPCAKFQTFSQPPFHQQQHIMHLQCLKPRHSSGRQSLLPL
jgi:hypothetical protein